MVRKAHGRSVEDGTIGTADLTDASVTAAKLAAAIPFRVGFVSTAQVITSAGALTLPHGLVVMPTLVQLRLICLTNDAGYLAGDELITGVIQGIAAGGQGLSIVPDLTNLNVRFGSLATVFVAPHKTTGVSTNLVNASWAAIFRAWA